jgi:DHA2 family multidrug resistance protein
MLFLLYAVVPMIVLVPLSIWLIRYYDVKLTLIIGLAAFAAAALLGTQLTHEWALGDFIPMVMLQSLGQSFTLLPIVIIALSNSDPSRATAFAAYIQVFRLGGAEIGIALMGTWLRVREQIHSNYLGQHIENGSGNVTLMLQKLSNFFASHGIGSAPARAVGTLAAAVSREAYTLAYIDGFWLCFWLAMAALGFTALITRAPPGPFTPAPFGFAKNLLRKCGVAVS